MEDVVCVPDALWQHGLAGERNVIWTLEGELDLLQLSLSLPVLLLLKFLFHFAGTCMIPAVT